MVLAVSFVRDHPITLQGLLANLVLFFVGVVVVPLVLQNNWRKVMSNFQFPDHIIEQAFAIEEAETFEDAMVFVAEWMREECANIVELNEPYDSHSTAFKQAASEIRMFGNYE